jgi:hypothetical protein
MEIEGAEFFRGPHDGLVLTMEQIGRLCHLVRAKGGDEERLFVMMPSLLDWNLVLSGVLRKDGPFDTIYAYELVPTDAGPALFLRGPDEYSEAAGG